MDAWLNLVYEEGIERWTGRCKETFDGMFGGGGGRYPARARNLVSLRAPESTGVPFFALIHPSNPDSGAYGGMSFVLFPVKDGPALVSMVVGTQGLSPDEDVLGRPGHARKTQAICAWLNKKYGQGEMRAWAKQDPVRIDLDIPDSVQRQFAAYKSVFDRYGKVIYGFWVPDDNREATTIALKAFLDLIFEERGETTLKSAIEESRQIRGNYLSHLMPDVSSDEVAELLATQRYVVLEGPPGTGKTRMARQLLQSVYQRKGISIQFHPNTTYENFVGGLAPVQTTEGLGFQFAPQKGHLMQAAEAAEKNPNQPYLLHIDEINRADLAKVLGEAIYLLEARVEASREIELPYDFDGLQKFRLPDNLHILGTMNTADRSIGIVDVAIRRRFAFVKIWPQMKVVQENSGELMQRAFRDLLSIFVEYAVDDAFSLVPGHSYFLCEDDTQAVRQLKVNLVPLLEEYLAQGYVTGFAGPIRSYLQWIESLS